MNKKKAIPYTPAVILDRTIDRSEAPKSGMHLLDEEHVVWLIHPSKLPRFVRSTVVLWNDRVSPPEKFGWTKVLGWATLSRAAEPAVANVFKRRLFWLDHTDVDGSCPKTRPVEAVDPLTIRPGVEGVVTDRVKQPQDASDAMWFVTRQTIIEGKRVFWLEAVPLATFK